MRWHFIMGRKFDALDNHIASFRRVTEEHGNLRTLGILGLSFHVSALGLMRVTFILSCVHTNPAIRSQWQ